jgi:hypothetical protein
MNIEDKDQDQEQESIQAKPDEDSGVLVEARIKIFDPETEEVYLEGRV